MIRISAIGKNKRNPELIRSLAEVWQASVRASHHFLEEEDILALAPQAEDALRQIETLWVARNNLSPIGFMGVQEHKIEMLFLHPDYFRKGLGKELVQRAFRELEVEYVDVNEQNPDAQKFYERMGFYAFRRDETDDQGNPFPVLRMKRLPATEDCRQAKPSITAPNGKHIVPEDMLPPMPMPCQARIIWG